MAHAQLALLAQTPTLAELGVIPKLAVALAPETHRSRVGSSAIHLVPLDTQVLGLFAMPTAPLGFLM